MNVGGSSIFNSTEDETIVDELCGLFPTFSRSEIVKRVNSCDNVEKLIDIMFQELESEQQNNSIKDNSENRNLYLLKDIFPEKLDSELINVLDKCNNNIETATIFLLEGSFTLTQERDKKINLDDLNSILELPSSIIRPYLSRNSYDPMKAIVDIIFNYKKANNVSMKKIPSGGRVQGRSSKPITSVEAYSINENSTEFKELKSIYVSNSQFSTMNDNFFEKALEFFKGNVTKVVEIATIVLDYDAAELTHDFAPKELPKIPISEILRSSVNRPSFMSKEQSIAHSGQWKLTMQQKSKGSSKYKNSEPLTNQTHRVFHDNNGVIGERSRRLDSTGVLDLHGLIVSDALAVVQDALLPWWKQEVTERLNHGRLDQFGSTISFVDPLHIITGRGLHSANGVSKVKKAVINYLNRADYIFEENSGSLDVIGKKKSLKQ